MAFKNMGTFDLGTVGGNGVNKACAMDAAGIASGQAFLVSELEKRDTLVRTPLTSFTYTRDIPIRVGGGWAEFVSAMGVGYGVTGGSGDGIVASGSADGIPMVQADFGKDLWKTHMISVGTRVFWIDQMRGNMTGRNMDTLLRDGVRMTYDKHMDENVYVGFAAYGSTGLLNNADVTVTNAATGAGGSATWATKTPDEILKDVNDAILAAWAASEYDLDAIPNHIVLPYEQYNYIATTKVSQLAEKTILTFLLENNVAKVNGGDLFIGATAWADGAGVGGADRMVVYCNKERYVAVDELVPLTRAMTTANAERFSYDTAYAGNVSEVETFYPMTMIYVDGI
jgi:hypothetical protein